MKRLIIVHIGFFLSILFAVGCGKEASNGLVNGLPSQSVNSTSSNSTSGTSGGIKSQTNCIATNGFTGSFLVEFSYSATTYSSGDQTIVCEQDNQSASVNIIASPHVSANNGGCIMGNPTKGAAFENIFYVSNGKVYVQAPGTYGGTFLMTCTTENF